MQFHGKIAPKESGENISDGERQGKNAFKIDSKTIE